MKQITYSYLKSPMNRDEMLQEKVVKLGTQSGHFGEYKEQARVITQRGIVELLSEIDRLASELGHESSAIFELMPTLEKLVK